jgi:hypothetical protein
MAVQNQLAKQAKKPSFGVMINSDGYKKMINSTLGDPKKATRFVTAISSAVATNPALQECDAASFDLKTVSGSIKGSILSGKVFDCHSTSGGVHVPENSEGGTFKARSTKAKHCSKKWVT